MNISKSIKVESTTDGILSDSDAEDLLKPEQPSRSESGTDPESDPRASLETLRRHTLERNAEAIRGVQRHLDEGDTGTAKFRNQVLKLTQNYYIKSSRLTEPDIVQLREQKVASIVQADGLLDNLCRLAFEAFNSERQTYFIGPEGAPKKEQLNLLAYVLTLCQNYTDQSEAFALALSHNDWALRLSAEMQRDWADAHLNGQLPDYVDKRLRQAISLVYNMLFKGNSDIFFNLAEYKFVETARPFLKSDNERFRFSAFLVLVFSCNEEEATKLLIHENSLAAYLVNNLRLAHNHASRRSNGYHVIELAKCAYQFTKNEGNKPLLIDCGILPVLSAMLQSPPDRSDEIASALKILLSMSFSLDCASALKEICGPELRTLASNQLWKSHRDLQAIKYNIEEVYTTDGFFAPDEIDELGNPPQCSNSSVKKPSVVNMRPDVDVTRMPPPPPPPQSAPPNSAVGKLFGDSSTSASPVGHVMISYHQHSSTEFVRWLCPQLTAQKFQVWVDYEKMQDSTLECMAKAVEGSAVVLMCVCKGYKESDNCRMEAEYAVRKQKTLVPLLLENKYKADGWLGFIMGTKLYYNFGRNKEDSLEKLLKYLKQAVLGQQSHEQEITPSVGQPLQTTPTKPPQPQPPAAEAAYTKWSSEEVAKWLLDNRLPTHLEAYKLEGRHLRFLVRMRSQAPEAFYRVLQKSLRLSMFSELFDFVDALERL